MEQPAAIEVIAGIIQLAVAPVFLLAGIAGFMNVLTTRLGRIVDRARIVERQIPYAQKEEQRSLLQSENTTLWSRIRLINWSIRLCVLGALMVCVVIVTLFIGDFATFNLGSLIAFEFVTAMMLVIMGLLFFLREINVSISHTKQGLEIAFEEHKQESLDSETS